MPRKFYLHFSSTTRTTCHVCSAGPLASFRHIKSWPWLASTFCASVFAVCIENLAICSEHNGTVAFKSCEGSHSTTLVWEPTSLRLVGECIQEIEHPTKIKRTLLLDVVLCYRLFTCPFSPPPPATSKACTQYVKAPRFLRGLKSAYVR